MSGYMSKAPIQEILGFWKPRLKKKIDAPQIRRLASPVPSPGPTVGAPYWPSPAPPRQVLQPVGLAVGCPSWVFGGLVSQVQYLKVRGTGSGV